MVTQILTQKRLKELLSYNPETGCFTRNIALKNQPAGAKVGTKGARGYLQTSIDGTVYKIHRLAWLYVHGEWPQNQIDHIDHDTSNNRIDNLRDVSCGQNHQNRNRNTKSASSLLGVGWHKRDKRWFAHIEINGKRHHLGYYADKESALKARQNAETTFHPYRPI